MIKIWGGRGNSYCDSIIIITIIIIISQATILSLCAEADSRVKEVWTDVKSISLVFLNASVAELSLITVIFYHILMTMVTKNISSITTSIMIGGWLNQSAMVLHNWLGPPKVLKWCHYLSFSLAITFSPFSNQNVKFTDIFSLQKI